MSSKDFTDREWDRIFELLETRGADYGLPTVRDDSVVLGSFNIRKFGPDNRGDRTWDFLSTIAGRFDLLAIQEVMDDLGGLQRLRESLRRPAWIDSYGVVCSDVTGQTPGARVGMPERLAFLYRNRTVRRTEIASDISIDKSEVISTLIEGHREFLRAFFAAGEEYAEQLAEWRRYQRYVEANAAHADYIERVEAYNAAVQASGLDLPAMPVPPPPVALDLRREPRPQAVELPRFVTFIRQPMATSFRVLGADPDRDAYEFLAVNAHLLYGSDPNERKLEFDALTRWLVNRACVPERMMYRDIMLFGDLNLSKAETYAGRVNIFEELKALNGMLHARNAKARINFPLLDGHPRPRCWAGDQAELDGLNAAEAEARAAAEIAWQALSTHRAARPNKGRTIASRAAFAAWAEEAERLDMAHQQAAAARSAAREAAQEARPVYRTNGGLTQTYDHIGIVAHDHRLPRYWQNSDAGAAPGEYDFGVFNFPALFADAVLGQSWSEMRYSQRRSLVSRFANEVSDHLPVWIRLPAPDGPPTWRG